MAQARKIRDSLLILPGPTADDLFVPPLWAAMNMDIFKILGMALGAPVSPPISGIPMVPEGQIPFEVDTGPPVFGAPPTKQVGSVQKEVQAIEQTPQAQLLDLLDEIISIDEHLPLGNNRPTSVARPNDNAALAVRIGDFKIDFDKEDLSKVLVAIGVQVPRDFSIQDIRDIRSEVADKIITEGLPANIRGLLYKFLKISETPKSNHDATPEPEGEVVAPEVLPVVMPIIDEEVVIDPVESDLPEIDVNADVTKKQTDFSNTADWKLRLGRPDHIDVSSNKTIHPGNPESVPAIDSPMMDTKEFISKKLPHQMLAPVCDRPIAETDFNMSRNDLIPRPMPIVKIDSVSILDQFNLNNILGDLKVIDLNISEGTFAKLSSEKQGVNIAVPTESVVNLEPNELDVFNEAAPFTKKEQPIQNTTPVKQSIYTTAQLITEQVSVDRKISQGDQDVKSEIQKVTLVDSEQNQQSVKIQDVVKSDVKINDTQKASSTIFEPIDEQNTDVTSVRTATEVVIKPETVFTEKSEPKRLIKEQANAVRDRVMETIQEMVSSRGHGRTLIRLQPDDLGTITIEVRSFGQNVEANVTASDERVRTALTHQRAELIQSVESKGLSLDSFSVGKESNDPYGNGRGTNQNQNQPTRQDFERAAVLSGQRIQISAEPEKPRYDETFRRGGLDTLA